MSRHWMPLYIGDYLADTRRLSLAEHGAYMLLIMEYWRNGGLPDDDAKLSRILGVSAAEWADLSPVLQEFFEPGWKHKRIDAELSKNGEISERRAAAANKRWSGKNNANADASAYASADANDHANTHAKRMRSQPQPQLLSSNEDNKREPSPLAVLQECLSEETAKDLIAHRKAKRAPLTARAAKLLVKQFIEYGNPEVAAETMIRNGWQGFHPTWLENQKREAPANDRGGMAALYLKLKEAEDGKKNRNPGGLVHGLPLVNGDERKHGGAHDLVLSGNALDLH